MLSTPFPLYAQLHSALCHLALLGRVLTALVRQLKQSLLACSCRAQVERQLEELEVSFKTAAALAEASGAYGEPHLYGLYKQASEGPCNTEKPG